MATASAARRRAVAGATAGGAAFAAYLLDYLGRAWDPARGVSVVSPFHFFEPSALVRGEPLRLSDVGVLFAIGIAGAAASYIIFTRRDI